MMALIDHFGEYKVHWKGRVFVPLYSPDGLRWRVAEEVLEKNGKSGAVVQQSGLRVPVLWSGKSELAGLHKPFKIRVAFEGVSRGTICFYALYVVK
jgi:hypothetical protein